LVGAPAEVDAEEEYVAEEAAGVGGSGVASLRCVGGEIRGGILRGDELGEGAGRAGWKLVE